MIYLEDFEREYLLHLLEGTPYTGDKPGFVVKKLIANKVKSDIERVEEIRNCEHTFGKYTGEKECCTKCGGLDVGMGESWTLNK